ncbi:MAG: hypothetical protein HC932_04085 [Thermales bacterium]|nr:hypothetical protein [Thermales bacterium]
MNLKAKIFTLIIAGMLIIPVLFNPPKSNSVLGVSEKTNPTNVANDNKTDLKKTQAESVQVAQETTSAVTNLKEDDEPKKKPSLKPNIKLPKINLNLGNFFSNKNEKQLTTNNFQIKDITSGVREKVDKEPKIYSSDIPEARGFIKWENSATTTVTSNKYSLGSSIKVNTSEQSGADLVISKIQVLPVDTILVVDQNTFIQLGGDPETQTQILGSISKTN